MKLHQTQFGYSLVEVLVSISVLLIAIVGPMTIASQGIKSASFALEQNTAFFLAQEGAEAMFTIRNNYGLKDVDDGIQTGDPDTSWGWIGIELQVNGRPCFGVTLASDGDSCSFGIDFRTNDVTQNLYDCNSGTDPCKLYLDETDSRAKYNHQISAGNETPFTRVITVTYRDSFAVEVTSVVTWESKVFGGTEQTVSLTSFIFDPII